MLNLKKFFDSIPLARSLRQYLQATIQANAASEADLARVYQTSLRTQINDLDRRSVELATRPQPPRIC